LPAILTLSATEACAQGGNEQGRNEVQGGDGPEGAPSRLLVAYFTRSGHTHVIAGTIRRTLSARLFEIWPLRATGDRAWVAK